jgi:Icc-related predicted phosphoesterase
MAGNEMAVSCVSDLHLEWDDCALPGGGLLLVAGDLLVGGELQPGRTHKEAIRNRDRYKRFVTEEFRKYWKVLVVLGNHDFWGLYFDEAPEVIREFLFKHAPNVTLLDNEFIELDGVRFIGSTLWASYGHGTANHYFLQKNMKDFDRIKKHGGRLLVGDIYEAHQKAVAFLKQALETDKPCVVMTHHAPSYLGIKRTHYPDGNWDDAYASNQHELILKSKLWIHGHSHYRYRTTVGETKLAANPRGYYGQERMSMGFDPCELDFDLAKFEFAS